MSRLQQVAADQEQILHDAVNGSASLKLGHRFEPPHLAFSLSGRLVRDLSPVVRILGGDVTHGRALSD